MHYRPILALGLSAAVLLGACGDDDDSTSSPATTTVAATADAGAPTTTAEGLFNDADVTVAQEMIPHHEQALEMATMATTKASSPEVKALAERIVAAQQPEIDEMTAWLEAWGEGDSPGGHDMGSSDSMPGMMSDDDMSAMEDATGTDFDRMFLEGMIEHHRGAIELAEDERNDGVNADAVALAETIIEDQEAEITEMEALLGQI